MARQPDHACLKSSQDPQKQQNQFIILCSFSNPTISYLQKLNTFTPVPPQINKAIAATCLTRRQQDQTILFHYNDKYSIPKEKKTPQLSN